ncbi:MAG: TetR/AcrR family transcriptional regulator [Solirubrobacterales bacterium]
MPETTATEPSRPRRLTRKEKQAETRRHLFDAAERVFLRRGLNGSSVEEISAEAGFTRGAFYSNFGSKEQLFIELLHDRIFNVYRELGEEAPAHGNPRQQLRWGAERLARMQDQEGGRWLFRLWLECLTQAARDQKFRELAATFWSGNRALLAGNIEREYERAGSKPPVPAEDLATAMTALDIGLAVQHLVDPDAVPLDLYVPLYELLFGSLLEAEPGSSDST